MKKIINISFFSRSKLNQDPIEGCYYGWHGQYARAINKNKDYKIEAWALDISLKKTVSYEKEGITYKIFSGSIFLAPGREFSWGLIKALKEETKNYEIIIHLHDFHNWQAYIICLLFRNYNIVVHYHGVTQFPLRRIKNPKKMLGAPLFLLEHIAETLALRRIKHIFLCNLKDKDIYARKKIPFSFCPMAANLDIFKKLDQSEIGQLKNKFGLGNEKIILNVGGFARQKKIEILIKAFSNISQKLPAILYIIGPTYSKEYEKEIKSLVKRLGLEGRVKITGMITREELNDYYNVADALVVSSSEEGGPTVVLEALAVGLPVVSTPVGFTKDILSKTNGLIRVTKNYSASEIEKECSNLLAGGNSMREERMKIWSWDDVYNTVTPIYNKLI